MFVVTFETLGLGAFQRLHTSKDQCKKNYLYHQDMCQEEVRLNLLGW